MSLLVKNGAIVAAEETCKGDIKISDGIITGIGTEIQPRGEDDVIDATNQCVFPGGVDPHVHFSHPDCANTFETGSAAAGGIASYVSFCEPPPLEHPSWKTFATGKR